MAPTLCPNKDSSFHALAPSLNGTLAAYTSRQEVNPVNDSNWKIWAAIFVLSIGVAFEIFKRLPGQQSPTWERESIQFAQDGRPYSVRNQMTPPQVRPMNRPQPIKVAATSRADLQKFIASNRPIVNAPAEAAVAADVAKVKKKKKKDGEWEVFIDPKTGKKMRRRKKKIVKKDEVEKVVEQAKDEPKRNDEDEIDNAIAESLTTGEVAPAPKQQAEAKDNSADEWARRLLSRPDLNETKRFIDQYNTNQVSAEVFYKVVELMIEDPRADMRKLGVLAAGLTPSVMSFQLLANVIKSEKDPKVSAAANGYTANYMELGNLYVLERILKSGTNGFAAVLAARNLELSAERYLKAPTTPTPGPSAQRTRSVSTFQRFLTVLRPLTTIADADLSSQARRTLSSIETLLGKQPAQPSLPTPPPTSTAAATQP